MPSHLVTKSATETVGIAAALETNNGRSQSSLGLEGGHNTWAFPIE
jgi:hypothetical protein